MSNKHPTPILVSLLVDFLLSKNEGEKSKNKEKYQNIVARQIRLGIRGKTSLPQVKKEVESRGVHWNQKLCVLASSVDSDFYNWRY